MSNCASGTAAAEAWQVRQQHRRGSPQVSRRRFGARYAGFRQVRMGGRAGPARRPTWPVLAL